MREIRTSGSTRGQWGAGYNRYPLSYSTGQTHSVLKQDEGVLFSGQILRTRERQFR
jgi:hypothetical protein